MRDRPGAAPVPRAALDKVPPTVLRVAASTLSRGAGAVSRALGRGDGAVIGGRLLSQWPGAARRLAGGRQVVLVSGTNGKTTTTLMLARALGTGGPVATNATGANTPPGILSALARSRAWSVVLECDEAWLPWCVEQTHPEVVVLLNISRDQLDRHHEVTGLARRWRAALSGVGLVVANADDPNVVWAAGGAQRQVWVSGHAGWTDDSTVCPHCGSLLVREEPEWSCQCGLHRPTPDWSVAEGTVQPPSGNPIRLQLALPGQVNQDNATTAIAAAAALGVDVATAAGSFAQVDAIAGRYSVHRSGDHRVRLLLAKNPAGWAQALAVSAAGGASVAVAVNANGVDGRDPSWLWDVSYTSLRGRPVVVCGDRALDAAVRLEVDEVDVLTISPAIASAVGRLPPGDVDLIGTYSAFSQARQEFARGH